jgi:hypothetical protein
MHLPLALCLLAAPASGGDPGPFVSALWLVQRHGTPEARDPRNDGRVKATLSKSLKDLTLTPAELEGLMDPSTFHKLAGADDRLDATEIGRALEADVPPSRLAVVMQSGPTWSGNPGPPGSPQHSQGLTVRTVLTHHVF